MSAEDAHHLVMTGLKLLDAVPRLTPVIERGAVELFGLRFPNRIGLAAGMDKEASVMRAWEHLGFGFIEVGTITRHAQPGNDKPRLFRIVESEAIINRMGFNNPGADVIADRLSWIHGTARWPQVPVGINLGKSKITAIDQATDDYLYSLTRLFDYGDYFVVNVSSPNTPNLRQLQDKSHLDQLLAMVVRRAAELSFQKGIGKKPVLLKVAPDVSDSQFDEILELATAREVSGLILTNTTIDHTSIPESQRTQGGLSGSPLRKRSTHLIRYATRNTKLPIVGVGGVNSVDAALEKLDAGASLIQLYTGLVYHGPALVRQLVDALESRS